MIVTIYLPFGEVLTDMERRGIKVNKQHLAEIEKVASEDCEIYADKFMNWAVKYCEDAMDMNLDSDAQKQQLLFAPCVNKYVVSIVASCFTHTFLGTHKRICRKHVLLRLKM